MPKQLLVRNVPEEVHKWIDEERQQQRMSQQEFVLSVLRGAPLTSQPLPLPFEQVREQYPTWPDLPFAIGNAMPPIGS